MIVIVALPACTANPERKQVEDIVKTNPLDMANEDAKTIVLNKDPKKPKTPKVAMVDPREAPFLSGKHARVFHARGCEYARSIESPVGFASIEDALRSGRVACEFCHPGTP